MTKHKLKKHRKGGPRAGSGRPHIPEKREPLLDEKGRPVLNKKGEPLSRLTAEWTQLTVTLRRDTVERLRAGAGKLFVGDFLQFHLDYYPILSHEEYQRYKDAPWKLVTAKFVTPLKGAKPVLTPEQRQRAWARKAYDRLSPGKRKAVRLAYPEEVRKLIRETNADAKRSSGTPGQGVHVGDCADGSAPLST